MRRYNRQARLVSALLEAAEQAERVLPDCAIKRDLGLALDAFVESCAFAVVTGEQLKELGDRHASVGKATADEFAEALILAEDGAHRALTRSLWEVLQQRRVPGHKRVYTVGNRTVIVVEALRDPQGRVGVTHVCSGERAQTEVHAGWDVASERARELVREHEAHERQRLGATGRTAWVAVPREDKRNLQLAPGTAVVIAGAHCCYEGNLYGASNLARFSERAKVAAGRLFTGAATVARLNLSPQEMDERFRIVGQIDDAYKLTLTAPASLVAYLAPLGTMLDAPGGNIQKQPDGWRDAVTGDLVTQAQARFIQSSNLLVVLDPLL